MARAKPTPLRYDVIEEASTARGRCVVCREAIPKGGLRLRIGWTSGFKYVHLACASGSREWAHWLDSALSATELDVPDRDALRAKAADVVRGVQAETRARMAAEESEHDGRPAADRIEASQAGSCLQCKKRVEPGALGVLEVRGVLHLACALTWAEKRAGRPVERWTRALFENTAGLDDADQDAVERAMRG